MGARNLCMCPGGTGVSVAVVGPPPGALLAKTERLAWREDSRWTSSPDLPTFVRLIVSLAGDLLRSACCAVEEVDNFCVSWPGPGDYEKGLLSATFIPGCIRRQPFHEMLQRQFSRAFGMARRSIPVSSALDVSVRARGELIDDGGAFYEFRGSGLIVNIGTGIACAVVRDGQVLPEAFDIGSTYGQLGRYLLRNSHTNVWSWLPTLDGSVPTHSYPLVRFTELCGGPALAHRFASLSVADDCSLPPGVTAARDRILANPTCRDLRAERTLLRAVTLTATEQPSSPAARFLTTVGADIGRAVCCLIDEADIHHLERIVLTGSIGERFGATKPSDPDLLIESIRNQLPPGGPNVVRSTLGLDAEYIGWAPLT